MRAALWRPHRDGRARSRPRVGTSRKAAQGYFTTYLLLENPCDAPVDVTLTFLREAEPPVLKTMTIGAHSR